MKVGFLITARLKSTRLPLKLLKEVSGKPIFIHMLDRLKLAKRVDQIIICTSTHPDDDRLAELATSEHVTCFRGDENDVLKRLYDAAVTFKVDYILNVTADCPFADPHYADKVVSAFESTGADLVRSCNLPHGAYCYGIKPSALKTVLEIKDKVDSEVWGRYFTDTDLFDVFDLPIDDPFHRQPNLRMTLDYPEDLQFFNAIFDHLYQPGKVFSLDEILLFLQENPQIVRLNEHRELTYRKRAGEQSSIQLKSRYEIKRAAILGCGSIGLRHIQNLRRLGITDIIALRSQKGHFKHLDPKLEVREVKNWDELINFQPDIALISNPTSHHLESARRLVPYVRGLFIEKPLAASLEGVHEFLMQIKERKIVSFIGYNLQFHEGIKTIRDLLNNDKLGKPTFFQGQCGHWLPEWHPYEDYKNAYYARKDLGGGATLTLIHEIQLAVELLGPAKAVSCFLSASELLPLEVDVASDLMLQHMEGAVSQIHLDFLQRPAHRSGFISCERGWISYDLIHPKVLVQFEGDTTPRIVWERGDYDINDSYIKELRIFLQYVSEGRVRHELDIWKAVQSQAIADAAFQSAKERRLCHLPTWVFELDQLQLKREYDSRKVSALK